MNDHAIFTMLSDCIFILKLEIDLIDKYVMKQGSVYKDDKVVICVILAILIYETI